MSEVPLEPKRCPKNRLCFWGHFVSMRERERPFCQFQPDRHVGTHAEALSELDRERCHAHTEKVLKVLGR